MRRKRGMATLVAIILLVVTPTAISLLWYWLTGNPLIRPLGITQEKIQAYEGGGKALEIIAVVEWDQARAGTLSQDELGTVLSQAFRSKGLKVRLMYRPSDTGIRVTYKVGPSVIGPFSQGRAAEGVGAAVDAYRMLARSPPNG